MSRIISGRHLQGWRPPGPQHMRFAAAHHLGDGIGVTPESKGFAVAPNSDLSRFHPGIIDQGPVGACTGCGGKEAHEGTRARLGLPPVSLSWLELYDVTRELVMHAPLIEDSGASVTDMIQAQLQYGITPEAIWPSDDPGRRYVLEPSATALAEGSKHKAVRVYSLSTLDWIKACLTLEFPVVFGFSVPQSFMSIGSDGQALYPKPDEPFAGGHCVTAYGHDDNHQNEPGDVGALRCPNSWGNDWGDQGWFWLPYRFVTDLLALDAWTIHDVMS